MSHVRTLSYRIELDGPCKSISAPTSPELLYAVADHYGMEINEIECVETDAGDVLAFVGGPHIGFVREVRV